MAYVVPEFIYTVFTYFHLTRIASYQTIVIDVNSLSLSLVFALLFFDYFLRCGLLVLHLYPFCLCFEDIIQW